MPRLFETLFGKTESALGVATVVICIVFALSTPYFLTVPNVVNLIQAYSVTTILAAGAFVVLVCGGIDISFTATASAAQYLAASLLTHYGFSAVPALALAAALGISLGCINALLTHYLRVLSIIVTIATSSVYYALLVYFTNAQEIYNLPDWWSNKFTFIKYVSPNGDVARITLPIVIMIAVVLLTQYIMGRAKIGRQIYAFGGNPEAAERIGIGVLKVQLFAYGYLGFLASVAGYVQAARVHQAVPTAMAGRIRCSSQGQKPSESGA